MVAWLDEHSPTPTYFVSLPIPIAQLEMNIEGQVTVFTINSGLAPNLNIAAKPNDENCPGSFEAVPQSEWRSGLASPNFNRVTHEVTHHIVHHSAGSNINTNYTQVVRDIYLFHTQVNGWSDIGYNFVVAQDGTIYEGRDPGPSTTEFEVMGAHFCGKNTGTMGIAMLGNFETAEPTEVAMTALESVLSFSLDNLEIDPLSMANHSGQPLNAISGHRDGCATLCPGKTLYSKLPELRESVIGLIDACNEVIEPITWSVFPNPVASQELLTINSPDSISMIELIHFNGRKGKKLTLENGQVALDGVQPGLYILSLGSGQTIVHRKLSIR